MELTPSQKFKKQLHDIIQDIMESADVWKTCLNCKFFSEEKELCLKCVPPARPPARTIAFGCPAFLEIDTEEPKIGSTIIPAKPKPRFDDLGDDIPF